MRLLVSKQVLLLTGFRTPSKDFELKYVEVIQRHHKRTPYNTNTFFKEDVTWDCNGSGPVSGLSRWVYEQLQFAG